MEHFCKISIKFIANTLNNTIGKQLGYIYSQVTVHHIDHI